MRMRRGFTIIEVSLFIAITALLFVGITVGTQNSINQQRYSDTVNDFTDFLRNIYSEVANPQSRGRGNSEQAIYGKLVMFGQLSEEDKIYVYDVVGNVEGKYSDDSLTTELKNLNATILSYRTSINDRKQILMSFNPEDVDIYTPKWGSKIEGLTKGSVAKLSLLVVRHPNLAQLILWFRLLRLTA